MSLLPNRFRSRAARMALILNAGLFALAAFTSFSDGKTILTGLCGITALANLLALRSSGKAAGMRMQVLLMLFNAAVAGATAYDYAQRGTQYLHLAWILVACISVAVAALFYRRSRRLSHEPP